DAVESVATHPLCRNGGRQREFLRQRRCTPVEGRIETRDLRKLRRNGVESPDRRKMVRLMQGRQRHQRIERSDHRVIDENGSTVALPTMDDAMAGRGKARFAAEMPAAPFVDNGD